MLSLIADHLKTVILAIRRLWNKSVFWTVSSLWLIWPSKETSAGMLYSEICPKDCSQGCFIPYVDVISILLLTY